MNTAELRALITVITLYRPPNWSKQILLHGQLDWSKFVNWIFTSFSEQFLFAPASI